jgi:hypothetical protein
MLDQDRFKINKDSRVNRLMLISGGSSLAALALANPVYAQSAAIDTATVNTQLTAVQSGIVAVGGTLLAMGMGILLFIIGKKIIKRVTG